MNTALIFNLAVVLIGGSTIEVQGDNSCGPRAVSMVLTHYQLPCDTEQLVAALQNGDPMQPCSVNDIASHLTARGLTVKVIESFTDPISWPYPVVLFRKTRIPAEESVGHFVAMLPKPEDRSTISIPNGGVVAILTAPSSRQLMIQWEMWHGQVLPNFAFVLSCLCLIGTFPDIRRCLVSVTHFVLRKG